MSKIHPIYGYGVSIGTLIDNGIINIDKPEAVEEQGSFIDWVLNECEDEVNVKGKQVAIWVHTEKTKEQEYDINQVYLLFRQPFLFHLTEEAKENLCKITKHDIALAMAKRLADWLIVPKGTAVKRIERELDIIDEVIMRQ